MDPWYLKKNFKPSSLRKYPQTAQYTHPRLSNTPPKRTQMLLDSLYVSVLLSNTSLQLKMSIYCNSFCSHLTAKKACIKAQKWFKLRYKALLTIWQCDESKGVFALTSLFLFFVLPSPCLVFCVITNVSIFFLLDALACYFFFLRLKQKAKKWRHEIVLPQQWWWSKQLFLH